MHDQETQHLTRMKNATDQYDHLIGRQEGKIQEFMDQYNGYKRKVQGDVT
jgi:hypothetical protein